MVRREKNSPTQFHCCSAHSVFITSRELFQHRHIYISYHINSLFSPFTNNVSSWKDETNLQKSNKHCSVMCPAALRFHSVHVSTDLTKEVSAQYSYKHYSTIHPFLLHRFVTGTWLMQLDQEADPHINLQFKKHFSMHLPLTQDAC
jgi:hypothetical protein